MIDFLSFNKNNNEKSIQSNYSEFQKHKNSNNDITVSLTQGDKFINYQNKIKEQISNSNKNQLFSNNNKEGFVTQNKPDLNLTNNTNSLLESTLPTQNDQSNLANLKKEYKATLAKYNKLQSKISKSTVQYLARVNSKNPYLNKTVRFTTGHIAYVTNAGVVKYVPSPEIWTSTGIPTNYVELNIPWDNSYSTPGTLIQSKPPLISGTYLELNQTVGNEGDNVYVNAPISGNPSYVGTYMNNNTTPMTFIGGEPGTTITVQNPNFAEPAIANDSYQYINDGSTVPGWYFSNTCLINNSSAWGFPTPYPYGSQACSVQGLDTVAQSFTNVEPGTYTLNLQACGRNCCDGSGASNPVNIQLNGTTFYTIDVGVSKWTPISTSFTVTQQGTNTLTFAGTNTGDRSTAIQGIQISLSGSSSGGTYSFDMCKSQAIVNGYQYFGIQDADATSGKGYCAVTNDYINATQPGPSYKTASQTALWSSSTSSSQVSSPGAYAKLTSLGTLQVYDSSGKSIFSTPGPSNSNYWGCYGDNEPRAILDMVGATMGDTTYSDCLKSPSSTQTNSVFGLQYAVNQGGNAGQCFVNNENNGDFTSARKYGLASNCTKDSSGNFVGGGWSNAVYGTQPGFECFLILQGDGNMVIYRGQNPSDNQGFIWASDTYGKLQQANPNWVSSTGKYSANATSDYNWVSNGFNGTTGSDNGFILYPGEYISSPSGTLKLIMQSDGNLVLYTSTVTDNYTTDANGNNLGGVNANSLYKFNNKPTTDNIGSLAYIDPNGQKHVYPNDNKIFNNNDYTKYDNLQQTSYQYSINGQQSLSTSLNNCKETCSNDSGCGGITYNTADGMCYYNDSNVSLYATEANSDFVTYMKNKKPKIPIYSNTTNNIDSVKYYNIPNGDPSTAYKGEYELNGATVVEQQQLSQLQDKLNELSSAIAKSNDKLRNDNNNILDQSKKNVLGTKQYLNEYGETTHKIKAEKKMSSNIEGILKDSNIVVLQENYNYAAWSILAIGIVIVSMNMVKKQ